MKTHLVSLLAAVLLTSTSTFAAGQEVTVAVKGMVCGFCAQGIQKKFSAEPSVEKVDVSLGEKRVKLSLKDGQTLSDDVIMKTLSDSGYNVEKIDRK